MCGWPHIYRHLLYCHWLMSTSTRPSHDLRSLLLQLELLGIMLNIQGTETKETMGDVLNKGILHNGLLYAGKILLKCRLTPSMFKHL